MPSQETLIDLFQNHDGIYTHKYPHHMEIYDRFFSKYRDKGNVRMLEIGIAQGGSLEIWRKYFGKSAKIFGADIQDRTYLADKLDVNIITCDQSDLTYWLKKKIELGPLDIIIDDGSHRCKDQIETFKFLFNFLDNDGIYVIEDIHTSYHTLFGGGYKSEGSLIEYLKSVIDDIHSSNYLPPPSVPELNNVFALHVFPSLAVIEKRDSKTWGGSTIRGKHEFQQFGKA